MSRSFSTGLEEDTTLFASVRWRRCKTASHRCQSPLFHVGLDEDEPALTKVHMNGARSIGADCRKEILAFETVSDIVELLAIASEEYAASTWSISDPNNVTLDELGTVIGAAEWLIISPLTGRSVGHRTFVQT